MPVYWQLKAIWRSSNCKKSFFVRKRIIWEI